MPTHTIIPVFAPYVALALSVQNLAMRPKKVPPLLFTSDTEGKKKTAQTLFWMVDKDLSLQSVEDNCCQRIWLKVRAVPTPAWFWVAANISANAGQNPGETGQTETPHFVCYLCQSTGI